MKRIRKGDTAIVIAGKSKGHIGKVLRVLDDKLVVEGANMMRKHVKPNPQLNEEGGIISREASLDVSNVAIYNPLTKKADKVGFKYLEKDGNKHKVRYFKSNNEVVDLV
jgi:large subunit ribosomal protein L24